ncbi:enoyl-CoA hydratase/isomerase [Seiridium cupressi]
MAVSKASSGSVPQEAARSKPTLATTPPPVPDTTVAFPADYHHVMLVTLNRPDALNAIPRPQHYALERLWDWYDDEPSLRVAVITGTGRAFCAGADLKEWDGINSDPAAAASQPGESPSQKSQSPSGAPSQTNTAPDGSVTSAPATGRDRPTGRFPAGGFGGMSNRGGLKPIIAAVNGVCFGGGMEMAINCDLIIAASNATFALPEVTIGVIALAGALPRLIRTVGKQRASEMALSGKRYTAQEMREWGIVNEVVPQGAGKKQEGTLVLEKALEWAAKIAGNSPDAVIVSREGLKVGWEGVDAEKGTEMLLRGWYSKIEKGDNMKEGVKSFVERRKPVWVDSKL